MLVTLPCSICYHPCLEILLLQGNRITQVNKYIGSLPKLRGLQLSQNPITYPTQSVLSRGSSAVIEYLCQEWTQHERKIANQMRQEKDGGGALVTANSVQIKAKRGDNQLDSPTGPTISGDSEGRNGKNKQAPKKQPNISGDDGRSPNMTLDSKKDKVVSGVKRGKYQSKLKNIDCKRNAVCMYVNKIKSGKIKSTDKGDMYEQQVVKILRKFTAANELKILQKIKDIDKLDNWREEYRMMCRKAASITGDDDKYSIKNVLMLFPYVAYDEYQKMLSRGVMKPLSFEPIQSTSRPRSALNEVQRERSLKSKMFEIQKELDSLDSKIKPSDGFNELGKDGGNELNSNPYRTVVNTSTEEETNGKARQNQLLEQINKMQSLQNEVKHLSKINDTLI
ncbi:hypothetical protein WDU94_002553 [Cyamophila willieti]